MIPILPTMRDIGEGQRLVTKARLDRGATVTKMPMPVAIDRSGPLGGDSSMSRPIVAALIVGAATTGLLTVSSAAIATELAVPPPAQRAQAAECGPCGCVHVTYDYHRELRSTYGLAFDPRNFDQTQPYYYFGVVRAYPRFWCDAIE